jgi:hypothetical protein
MCSTSCATLPTIADLRAEGVAGARVWRTGWGCIHRGKIAYDAMRTPPETPIHHFGAVAPIRLFSVRLARRASDAGLAAVSIMRVARSLQRPEMLQPCRFLANP